MKFLILATSLIYSLSLLADHHMAGEGAGGKEQFTKMKAEILSHIDEQISALTETKSCISSATNGEGMKACHEVAAKKRAALQEKQKAKRGEMIDEKIKRLQEQKSKMNEKKGEKKE